MTDRAPSPDSERLGEFKKLLDNYHFAVIEWQRSPELAPESPHAQAIFSSRSAIVELFRKLEESNSYLRKEWNLSLETVASLSDDLVKMRQENKRLDAGIWKCTDCGGDAWLACSKCDLLTDDDKEFIQSGLLLHAPRWRIPDELAVKLRLRSLTSGA